MQMWISILIMEEENMAIEFNPKWLIPVGVVAAGAIGTDSDFERAFSLVQKYPLNPTSTTFSERLFVLGAHLLSKSLKHP